MCTILVIEDNPVLRSNLEEIFTSEGYRVDLAVDGEDGYNSALQSQPDLIISDIQMPKLNGLDLLEKLQCHPVTEAIPVILFSAHADTDHIRKGMSIGADDYITKPFKIDDLLKTVAMRLKKKKKLTQKVDVFKNTVIKKVAHELRTPLISILSYPQLLEENIDDLSTEEIKTIASGMKQSGSEMYRNVEKILVYSDLLYLCENKEANLLLSTNEYRINSEQVIKDLSNDFNGMLSPAGFGASFEEGKLHISKEHYMYFIKEVVDFILHQPDCGKTFIINGFSGGSYYKTKFSFSGKCDIDVFSPRADENKYSNENIIGNGLGLNLVIAKSIAELYGGYINVNYCGANTEIEAGFHLL